MDVAQLIVVIKIASAVMAIGVGGWGVFVLSRYASWARQLLATRGVAESNNAEPELAVTAPEYSTLSPQSNPAMLLESAI